MGVHAAQSSTEVAAFFGFVNRLYNFFSGCPERWAILKQETGCSLHRPLDTRWSANIAAVKAVATSLPSILVALECVISTCNLTSDVKSEAKSLKTYFHTFDAVILLTVWVKVLQSIEHRNLILQAGNISLDIQAANIRALQDEMQAMQGEWDSLLAEASLVAQSMDIPTQFQSEGKRKQKRKRMPDEDDEDEDAYEDNAANTFRNQNFFVAMDSIISALSSRFQTTASICETFAPILKFADMSEEQIKVSCWTLTRTYPSDLTDGFEIEVLHLKTIYEATFPHNLRT